MWFGEDRRANIVETRVWKGIDYVLFTPHLIVTAGERSIMCSFKGSRNVHLWWTLTRSQRVQFFRWICFIANLLVQHTFCCVNLLAGSWRTWKMNIMSTDIYSCIWSQYLGVACWPRGGFRVVSPVGPVIAWLWTIGIHGSQFSE